MKSKFVEGRPGRLKFIVRERPGRRPLLPQQPSERDSDKTVRVVRKPVKKDDGPPVAASAAAHLDVQYPRTHHHGSMALGHDPSLVIVERSICSDPCLFM